ISLNQERRNLKEFDPSSVDYRLNRGVLFAKTLREHLRFQAATTTPRAQRPPMSHLVPDGDGHATILTVDPTFLLGHKRIVDSLEADLRSCGEGGGALADQIIFDITEGGETYDTT